MIAIITGDVINSSDNHPSHWLSALKTVFNRIGKSPGVWEIYRGDSFQLMVKDPVQALTRAIEIKATVKTLPGMDVRMAIGLGEMTYQASRITESNGTAFIHSGEKFERLKKEKQNLALQSDWDDFDREMNLLLKLGLIAMDNWTENAAEIMSMVLENAAVSQETLGSMLHIRQSAVSRRLKRAYYDEIMALAEWYQTRINMLL